MAGRPPAPIPDSAPPALKALVQRLRNVKESSGKTIEVLAEDSGFSESVVRRALAGRQVPLLETVMRIADACGGQSRDLARLWTAAKAEKVLPGVRKLGPAMVTSPVEFVDSMNFMRIDAGYPSLRQLERHAGSDQDGRTRLPHSTLHLVLAGQVPPAEGLFTAFMDVLAVPSSQRHAWLDAHRRVFADVPARRAWGEPPLVGRDVPAVINSCEAAERALSRIEETENIKRRAGQLPEPDDYELLGLGYLNTPAPGPQWPELYDDEELAAWEAEAAARLPAQKDVDLREKLRAMIDRSERA
ncbi:helix-turn-helix domain-containing protein [Streptomyces violaceusniger]|uniref:helix-turn-helix domain-containing protein n=1 Tax=Streptomyces violaceusniger TaxID=68280 RepID=UPI0036805D68